jgi:hypothetical protein
MPEISYPTQNIHLPPHRASISTLQAISLIGSGVIFLSALLLLTDLLFNLHLFTQELVTIPTILAFLASSAVIFLYKKNRKFRLLGVVPMIIGLLTLLSYTLPLPFLTFLSAGSVNTGLFFVLIGLALFATILRIPHRYHFRQLAVSLVLSISLFGFLDNMYHFIVTGSITGGIATLLDSLLFFILSLSIIFMKPDRGFIGLFTTESRSSQLARMSFYYFITMPPLLGFLLLFGENLSILTPSGRLALLVVLVMLISIFVTWLNVRFLYRSEVEHFLMKEALRINNISLEMSATDLSSKVNELEKAKTEVTKKFDNQQSLVDIMDSS